MNIFIFAINVYPSSALRIGKELYDPVWVKTPAGIHSSNGLYLLV